VVVVTADITEREKALTSLRQWYDKWAQIADAFIHNRRILILLGLARKRTSRDDGSEQTVVNQGPAEENAGVGPGVQGGA
jgi:hypothetical protein